MQLFKGIDCKSNQKGSLGNAEILNAIIYDMLLVCRRYVQPSAQLQHSVGKQPRLTGMRQPFQNEPLSPFSI
jgi:hypothetical protein